MHWISIEPWLGHWNHPHNKKNSPFWYTIDHYYVKTVFCWLDETTTGLLKDLRTVEAQLKVFWFEKLPCPRLIRIANEMTWARSVYNITFVFQEVFFGTLTWKLKKGTPPKKRSKTPKKLFQVHEYWQAKWLPYPILFLCRPSTFGLSSVTICKT